MLTLLLENFIKAVPPEPSLRLPDAAGIDVIGVPDLVDISDMTQSHLLCTKENLLKVLDLIK